MRDFLKTKSKIRTNTNTDTETPTVRRGGEPWGTRRVELMSEGKT